MAARTVAGRFAAAALEPRIGKMAASTPAVIRQASSSAPHRQASHVSTSITSSKPSASSSSTPEPLPSPFETAKVLPRTHNHHVASLHLRAYGRGEEFHNLQYFCDFALRAGFALGIPLSRPASLPTRTSLWTVLKGPFVHKKSQENFQRRVHKRVIKVWDADMEVVERWLQFLRVHCMHGVGMRAELYRQFPLSIGASLLAASTSQLRQVPAGSSTETDATIRASDGDSAQVARLARAIVDEEIAKQDAEDAAEQARIEARSSSASDGQEAANAEVAAQSATEGADVLAEQEEKPEGNAAGSAAESASEQAPSGEQNVASDGQDAAKKGDATS